MANIFYKRQQEKSGSGEIRKWEKPSVSAEVLGKLPKKGFWALLRGKLGRF